MCYFAWHGLASGAVLALTVEDNKPEVLFAMSILLMFVMCVFILIVCVMQMKALIQVLEVAKKSRHEQSAGSRKVSLFIYTL